MSRKTLLAGLLSLVATAATLFVAPSAAMAAEADFYDECSKASVSCQNGVSVTSGPSARCGNYFKDHDETEPLIARACVVQDGDYVYVYDGYADGNAALAQITASSGVDVRLCRNGHGNGIWVRCNFDWSENASKTLWVGVSVSHTKITVFQRFTWTGA